MSDSNPKIDVHYTKSNYFRVIYAEGVYGGLSPRGTINMAFYNERSPLPVKTSIEVINGSFSPEKIEETKSGFFREIETNIVMDLNAATAFYIWLGDKVQELRKHAGVSDENWQKIVGDRK